MNAQFIEKYHNFYTNTKKRFNFVYGSASSGKSHATAQYLIKKFYQEEKNKIFLVIRTTLPSLRITAYKLIIDLISEYKLPLHLNKSEMKLEFNGNEMYFKSLLDSAGGIERIKSFNVNYIWAEELTDFSLAGFRRLNLILRAKNEGMNQLYGTFNPIDTYHWINQEFFEKRIDDCGVLHTTYKDNPFNDAEYIKELEALKEQDENYYNIYAKGLWGMRKNIIYENWKVVSYRKLPKIESCDEVFYGLDFGFNNPSALVEIRVKDNEIFEKELLYQTHLTNPELIEKVKPLIYNKTLIIYCDSSEPDRIKDFKNAGFNAKPARKPKNSVRDGIDIVKSKKVNISDNSVNLIKEKRAYKYKEDSDGHALEEPVKFNDHLLDAERMAIFTHMGGRGVKKGGVYYPGKPKKKVDTEKEIKLIMPSTKGKIRF